MTSLHEHEEDSNSVVTIPYGDNDSGEDINDIPYEKNTDNFEYVTSSDRRVKPKRPIDYTKTCKRTTATKRV